MLRQLDLSLVDSYGGYNLIQFLLESTVYTEFSSVK